MITTCGTTSSLYEFYLILSHNIMIPDHQVSTTLIVSVELINIHIFHYSRIMLYVICVHGAAHSDYVYGLHCRGISWDSIIVAIHNSCRHSIFGFEQDRLMYVSITRVLKVQMPCNISILAHSLPSRTYMIGAMCFGSVIVVLQWTCCDIHRFTPHDHTHSTITHL